MKTQTESDSQKKNPTHSVRIGLIAALVATTCCVGPLVPILLGVGGAGVLFGLDRYKPLFLGMGVFILAFACWWTIRRQNRCCAVKNPARNVRIVATIFGVGVGAYVLLQYVLVPVLARSASDKVAAQAAQSPEEGDEQVNLQIEGMTCAGCAVGVESAFLSLPGVRSAKVDWKTGAARVFIDPTRLAPADLLQAEVEPQFRLSISETPSQL